MDKSEIKPCFREKTCQYGFFNFRSSRMVFGRFGWLLSR